MYLLNQAGLSLPSLGSAIVCPMPDVKLSVPDAKFALQEVFGMNMEEGATMSDVISFHSGMIITEIHEFHVCIASCTTNHGQDTT